MNSIWNKNISAFKKRFPSLADIYGQVIQDIQKLQANEGDLTSLIQKIIPSWEIIPAKNGSLTALENKIRLHSSYNPQREAQQTSEKLLNDAKKLLQVNAGGYTKASIVFLGFGLGYQICELSEKIKEEGLENKIKIILIEPEPAYFFATLNILDWTKVFEIEELILAIGCPVDSVIPLLENQEKLNLGGQGISSSIFFTNPPFIAHNQEYFNSVLTLIERNKSKNEINAATYEKFVKLWAKNSIKNIHQIEKCRTINEVITEKTNCAEKESLKDKDFSKEKNFLLIAAGPSLEKILPYLHQLKGRMTLVCVETALHALLKARLEPDYIVLTDPQFWAYKHIAGLQASESTLVCPISVYPDVFRFKCREIILCSDLFPISRYFEKLLGTFGDLGAGGSVASSAWTLCQLLGAKNIYLAGLDLAFPNKQSHIKGSSGEQAFFTNSSKINAAEKSLCRVMYGANPEYGLDYKGEKVLTDSRMKMFAWWFESKIAASPETKTFSLSEQSLKIPGVIPVSIEELAAGFKNNCANKAEKLVKQGDMKSIHEALSDAIKSYRTNLNKLQALINKAVEKCIINDTNLSAELEQIKNQLRENPLYEIIRLGKPSQKYLSEHQTTPPQLALYQKIQKELEYYLI